jgi:DNA-binding NarL/FixJ family response regulator
VKLGNGPHDVSQSLTDEGQRAITVMVAVESAQVREALAAMLGTLDGFRVVAEVDNDQAAIEAAHNLRPQLALVEPELSGCGGWWVIQRLQTEHLAGVVVALGRRAHGAPAHLVGAHTYVQMGVAPRDLLSVLEAATAVRQGGMSGAQAEHELIADAHPMR